MPHILMRGGLLVLSAVLAATGLSLQGPSEPEGDTMPASSPAADLATAAVPAPERLERLPPGIPAGVFDIRGGHVADPASFPAMLYFTKTGHCSGTLVAERVLLTARHCVIDRGRVNLPRRVGSDQRVEGTCEHARDDDGSLGADIALCLLDSPVVAPFERLNSDDRRPRPAEKILLAGFGCADFGKPDTERTFRTGDAWTSPGSSGASPSIIATGGASLCLGDSGGAAFLALPGDRRLLIAVNSQVAANDDAELPSVTARPARAFLRAWSTRHGQPLCGLDPRARNCRT